MVTASYPAGLIIDLEATPPLVSRPHDAIVVGIVGTAATATAAGAATGARYGEIYTLSSRSALSREAWTLMDGVTRAAGTAVTPADFLGAGSCLDGLNILESIGNFTVVLIPVVGNDEPTATEAVTALKGHSPKPDILVAPDAVGGIATPVDLEAALDAVASALNTAAGEINAQAVIDIPDAQNTADLRTAWAATYVPAAASPGTIRRARPTLGTSRTGATGTREVRNSLVLAAYMALTQSEDLGEDPVNTHTIMHRTTPVLGFDVNDFSTPAQVLAGAFITPVVRFGGGLRFWGRASGPDPDDDHGYVAVLDQVFREIQDLLAGYSQRNLPGETIDIIVSRAQHLVDHRRRDGRIGGGGSPAAPHVGHAGTAPSQRALPVPGHATRPLRPDHSHGSQPPRRNRPGYDGPIGAEPW